VNAVLSERDTDREVVWRPSPKQAELLACNDFEVLYGGAAGGGKTDGLLVDAWCTQSGGPDNPHHRAVIFRKSYPELRDLIDRANDLYPRFIRGIKYNKTDKLFTAPSGAKLELAYCANDADRFQYRGRAWNYLGFEELTLWASRVVYDYLCSRCRTTDRTLPRYIRATTNPDGPGQAWVMRHWGIGEDGQATLQEFEQEFEELDADGKIVMRPRMVRRRFIPAKLSDNQHLVGTGYRETLMNLPPDDRDALLKGLWTGNRVRGAYFQTEMQRARAESRLRPCVPHMTGIPVNTFWDLGWNDTTAIWFHQFATLQNRFLHAYEASGESLAHYAQYLQRLSTERGYVFGMHYLPHDAEHKSLQTGKSVLEQLKTMLPGHRFTIVPRVEHKLTSIQAARAALASCWFDAEECADGIAALDAYRKKWNNRQEVFLDEPEHDRFSNYADAFQQFAMGFNGARTKAYMPQQQQQARRPSMPANNWRAA
jgi:hypothetical protein